jgi:hypothetical protein
MSGVPVRPEIRPGEVERVRISALTEFVPVPSIPDKVRIKTLIELIDPLDTSVKAAFTARFELYEFRPLSSNPRGRRLLIWPEQNLNDPGMNNEHWQDFLRGYEFYLPLEFVPQQGKKYLLEVNCTIGQRRLDDLFKMQYRL